MFNFNYRFALLVQSPDRRSPRYLDGSDSLPYLLTVLRRFRKNLATVLDLDNGTSYTFEGGRLLSIPKGASHVL